MGARGAWLLLAAALGCAPVQAADEHDRRLAAELIVMAGDVRRLLHETLGPLERQGLEQRLSGALSSLPLLLRRARTDVAPVQALRTPFQRGDLMAFSAALARLIRRHPFDPRPLLAATPTPPVLRQGAAIHNGTCAACHTTPSADTLFPMKNLAAMYRQMSHEEFAARLWLGVRGDRLTSLANPFSDLELAALTAWYASGR